MIPTTQETPPLTAGEETVLAEPQTAEQATLLVVDAPATAPGKYTFAETPLDTSKIKQRATAGVVVLLIRRVLLQGISIIATTLLMRILSVEEFGIYAIAAFVVTLGTYFGDAGLGSALVQRKEAITQEDLNVVFTVQSSLLVLATLGMFLIAPWVQHEYKLPEYATTLLRVLSLSLLISSFKTVPAIILERRLEYQKLSTSDIADTLTFQIVAVVLALAGWHVWSFAAAALAQAAAGSLVLYKFCPWRPGISFSLRRARALLRFGGLVQARTLVIVLKDNITPTLIALIGGPLAVGYVNFAQKLASYPLQVEAATSRVAFPAYSRIQDDLSRLQAAIEKTLKLVNLILFPLTGLLLVLAAPLTHFVFGAKWLPALPAFYLFSLANLTAGTSNVLVTSLYALGRPGAILKLSLFWAVATWVIALPLVLWAGWFGYPLAVAILAITVILPVREVRKVLPVAVLRPILKPAAMALGATGVTAVLGIVLNATILGVLLNGLLGLAVYGAGMFLVDGPWIAGELLSSLPPALRARVLHTPLGAYLRNVAG